MDATCYRLNVHPQNSYASILILIMMISGGGASGRCLGHQSGALINGIGVLIKETPGRSLVRPDLERRRTFNYMEGGISGFFQIKVTT